MDQQLMTEPTKRRRRWFSLSLRGMMVLILVVGGLMGWKARRASLQRRAVARIERLQGNLVYDWQPQGVFPTPAATAEPPGPKWLRKMLGDEYFQEVVGVTIPGLGGPHARRPSPDDPVDSPERQAYREKVRRNQEAEKALAKDELSCLEGLDRIETLTLHRPPLKSEGLARLGRLTSLKELTIHWALNAEGLTQVAKLSNLEQLHLYAHFKLGDDSKLALLERLPRLKSLTLFKIDASIVADKITDASLARLGQLQHLNSLTLDGSEVTDAGLAHLKGLTQLESLRLDGSARITDAGLGHLKELKSLKILSLGAAINISDEGLAQLKGLKELEELKLGSASGVTDAGIAHLVGLQNLYRIELNSASGVTDAGVDHLLRMPQIRGLKLNARSLTDAGLNRLQSLKNLKGLILSGAKIKGEILDGIQAAIPGLMIWAERIDDEPETEAGPQPSTPGDPAIPTVRSPFEALTPPPAVPRN
jgi:hypothetical protein